MKKKSKTGQLFTRIFNIREWLDTDRVYGFASYFAKGIKKLFIPNASVKKESFDEVQEKYGLSNVELSAREKGLRRLSVLMLVLGLLVLSYCLFNIYQRNLEASIISFVVSLIAAVLAFRYHFWAFQIRMRKLGCTVQEWYSQGLKGGKK